MSKNRITSFYLSLYTHRDVQYEANVNREVAVDDSEETWTARKSIKFASLKEAAEWLLAEVEKEVA